MRTATPATEPAGRPPTRGVATSCAALLTHGSVAPEAQASRQLRCTRHTTHQSRFIRSALSEGLSSNRHCELLEFAVTRRKQTTDTRSKSSLFSPTRNGSTPQIKSCRSRITNHKSRVTNLANSRYNQAFICASPQSNGCTEQAITEALKGKNA
jgi:hypothetical protein